MTVNAPLPPLWRDRLDVLDHAFQPIVNVHSGLCYGYEALLRNTEAAGFSSIPAVFDQALADGLLPQVELALWIKAIGKLARLPHRDAVKLFCNADNRGALTEPGARRALVAALHQAGFSADKLCVEISERHNLHHHVAASEIRLGLAEDGLKVALDDFGRGFSGLELLYSWRSDFVKIDRFFLARSEQDRHKRLLSETIVKLAHLMGCTVVAEGIESEAEFDVCRAIGCDLLQGYLVQHPALDVDALQPSYPVISRLVERDRRRRGAAVDSMAAHIVAVPTISAGISLSDVIDEFGRHRSQTFLVVTDADDYPVGVVREQDLKDYLYNPFGRDLLSNAAYRKPVSAVLSRCPVVDINAPLETFIDTYVQDDGNEGVIVMRDMKYAGFLDSRTLLNIVSERNLAAARDQNPLTRLPGNQRIYEFVSHALSDVDTAYTLVYFDLDNFKPFNDRFGFRQGDRALILFSELLAKGLAGDSSFIGHIGGDDFFAAVRDVPCEPFCGRVRQLQAKFRYSIESFYDAQSRAAGFMIGTDRDGQVRRFPLLSVSAVALSLPQGRTPASIERISELIADGKKLVKRESPGTLHIVTLPDATTVSPLGSERAA